MMKARLRQRILPLLLAILAIVILANPLLAAPNHQESAEETIAEITDVTQNLPTFFDDFATWDERWTLGSGGLTNHGGEDEWVTIQGLGDDVGWMTHTALDELGLTDYFAEAVVGLPETATAPFIGGLLFRYVDEDNFYVFTLEHQDEEYAYAVYRITDGSEESLVEAQPIDSPLMPNLDDPAIVDVVLGLLVVGDEFTLLINDEIVETVTDDTHASGSIGVGAAVADSDLPLHFDDVTLWALGDVGSVEESVLTDDAVTDDAVTDDEAMAVEEEEDAAEETAIDPVDSEEVDSTESDTEETATEDTDTTEVDTAERVSLDTMTDELTEKLDAIRVTEPDSYDEFRRANQDWSGEASETITVEFADGMRLASVAPADGLYDFYQPSLETAPADFLIEVETDVTAAGALDQYGLVFRYSDDDNFYVFVLYGEGYTLWRKYDGEWESLVSAPASPFVAAGGENRVGVFAQGELLALLVNDTVVDLLLDDSILAGSVGLYAAADSDSAAPIEVAFDNFEFWEAPTVDVDPAAVAAATATDDSEEAAEDISEATIDDSDTTIGTETDLDVAAITSQLDNIYANPTDYYDEFRREDGTWLGDTRDEITISYEDRARQIAIGENLITIDLHAELLELAPANYLVEVDTSFESGDEQSQYGLVFRAVDMQNLYYFGLWQKSYSLWVLDAGTWTQLVDWTTADVIDQAGTNRLGVLAQGSTITLLLNDTVVNQTNDERFVAGGVGLYVETEPEGEAVVTFDNFDFWLVEAATDDVADEVVVDEETVLEEGAEEETALEETADTDTSELAATISALRETEADIFDGFRRDTGEWNTRILDDREIAIIDRTLVFDIRAASSLSVSAYEPAEPLPYDDYYVEVTATQLDGDDDGNHGIVFRYVDGDNFYFFDINYGGYGLQKLVDGEWIDVIEWTDDERIEIGPGVAKRMGVWMNGTEIALLLDEEIVATATDDTFASGGIGLAAGTYDAETYVASFDDLQVWALSEMTEEMAVLTPVATATPVATEEALEEDEALEATATPDAPATTALYEDEDYRFTYPADWEVMADDGVVTVRSEELDATVVIVALYSPQMIDAASADELLRLWTEVMDLEDVTWSEGMAWGDNGRYVHGSTATRDVHVAGSWVNSPAGSAFYLYTTGVLQENVADTAPVMAEIVESFTVKGNRPPVEALPSTFSFATWEEPDAGAFTINVPAEWDVEGGVLQLSEIDQRRWVTTLAPDQSIFAAVGDNRVGAFIAPNAALAAEGYVEGDSIILADTEFTVWPYRPGEEFLVDYVEFFLDLTDCDLEPQVLPELTDAVRDYVQRNNLEIEFGNQQDAGLLTYTCGSDDDSYIGFLVAVTSAFDSDGTTLWQPTALYAYETLPDLTTDAATVLQEMIRSYSVDERWLMEQFGYTESEVEEMTEHAAVLAELIADLVGDNHGVTATTAIVPASMEDFLMVTNPTTGEQVETFLDPIYSWLDSEENILGTATSALPADLDFGAVIMDVE